ncbi:DNA repair protein RadA [Mollicutes bacterium LVI A0039]|nr:DNA repair protein RadA [Mollicutes bacterium LVI A0039]
MYICNECQSEYKKWYGQCPKCKAWNTIEKGEAQAALKSSKAITKEVLSLNQINLDELTRLSSGMSQLDLVLGGGFVPGSLSLLGGRPGIGKSTLILKLADFIAKSHRVLYVSGEENLGQIKLRANRLGVVGDINFLNEQNSHHIMATALANKIEFLIIDSIQTTASPEVSGASGSVSQLKAIALEMMEFAKKQNITIVLIGHVTKDGDIAGPKLLEHMVDTVMYLESDNLSDVRLIRSEKNRFGTTNEIGMLEMTTSGLVTFDQNKLLKTRPSQSAEGVAMSAIKVGGRTIFLEVQSLITNTAYPSPKRSSQGIDLSRLNIMLAIIQKHMHIALNYDDVYLKLRGNVKGIENGIDLGLIASLYSAKCEFSISSNDLFLGEVTLTGEILPVAQISDIVATAEKLGYTRVFCNSKIEHPLVHNCLDIRSVLEIIRS